MQFIGVDLGSTNIKAACYDEKFHLLDRVSWPVTDLRDGPVVEFDAEAYFDGLVKILKELLACKGVKKDSIKQIVFTGQAESLIVLGENGKPLMNAMSWMDERSVEECEELAGKFDSKLCEAVTGQQAVLPTWPATKTLWLQRHAPEVFNNAAHICMSTDYIVYRLTGVKQADMSIATFSFYFDIYEKKYWQKMLDTLSITTEQLPELVEPCTVAGTLTKESAAALGLPESVKVNHGTLDHFTGMVGTGNVEPGGVSLSTGTVMALATMAKNPVTDRNCGIAMHYGFRPDTHIMLPVAESGGVSLEWFRKTCMPDVDYGKLNKVLAEREHPSQIIFLPYLVGTNSPEFDHRAIGVFFGLRAEHDAYDMAAAVMEGVAGLLRKNCDGMSRKGAEIQYIIATGGGAKSDVWCQMQADITGLRVVRPAELEAACLGAAIIGTVSEGVYADYKQASEVGVRMDKCFEPHPTAAYERNFKRFCKLYDETVKLMDIE
ncbi:MAG: hypothetical protein MJ118_07105 [Clostridia bacterium]|nr:hypothetical protein [Clostridia bacterium]